MFIKTIMLLSLELITKLWMLKNYKITHRRVSLQRKFSEQVVTKKQCVDYYIANCSFKNNFRMCYVILGSSLKVWVSP